MSERFWLVHPNGGRQLIDPSQFDVTTLAEQARQIGGRLVVERDSYREATAEPAAPAPGRRFEPPISALGPLFCDRFAKIYQCQSEYSLEINVRPTTRVLGGYYKTRRLVRVYSHDRVLGR